MRKQILDISKILADIENKLSTSERAVDILCDLLANIGGDCHPYLEDIAANWKSRCAKINRPCSSCWKEYVIDRIKQDHISDRMSEIATYMMQNGIKPDGLSNEMLRAVIETTESI